MLWNEQKLPLIDQDTMLDEVDFKVLCGLEDCIAYLNEFATNNPEKAEHAFQSSLAYLTYHLMILSRKFDSDRKD